MTTTTAEIRRLAFSEEDYDKSVEAAALVVSGNPEPATVGEYATLMKPVLDPDFYEFLIKNQDCLTDMINNTKRAKQDFFSIQTFKDLFSKKKVAGKELPFFESPRLVYFRVAAYLHMPSLPKIRRCYQNYCAGRCSPSTPTLINAGYKQAMLASCFVDHVENSGDSIFGELLNINRVISKNASQGIDLTSIQHSEMSNGIATGGVIPVLSLISGAVEYSKCSRKGNATVFLDIWHLDIEEFIQINIPIGDAKSRFDHVHAAIWTNDLFWKRLSQYNPDDKRSAKWTLFCPKYVPKLQNTYGKEFEECYLEYENDPNIPAHVKKEINAVELFLRLIIPALSKSGKPFILNRDAITRKSNHQHLGRIGSNLCIEIFQHLDKDNFPTCNLHSISLRHFAKAKLTANSTVEDLRNSFDFSGLATITYDCLDNLNAMMRKNFYPLDKIEGSEVVKGIYHRTNDRYRAVAIGVSGFASALAKLDLTFYCPLTREFNRMFMACIYFNALCRSVDASIRFGPCEAFEKSPASAGQLQYDLWNQEARDYPNEYRKESDPVDPLTWGQKPYLLNNGDEIEPSWQSLKAAIAKYGLYNSLVTALMPTNNSAQTCRNSENIEPIYSNLYSRKTLVGNFTLVNRYLIKDLQELGLWNTSTVKHIRLNDGSVSEFKQYLIDRPEKFPDFNGDYQRLDHVIKKYQTAWEIPQELLLQLSIDRGRYVDQGESHNVYMFNDGPEPMFRYLFLCYQMGAKVYNYYFSARTREKIKIGHSETNSCTMCTT